MQKKWWQSLHFKCALESCKSMSCKDLFSIPPTVQKSSQNILDTSAAILCWWRLSFVVIVCSVVIRQWSWGVEFLLIHLPASIMSIMTFYPLFKVSTIQTLQKNKHLNAHQHDKNYLNWQKQSLGKMWCVQKIFYSDQCLITLRHRIYNLYCLQPATRLWPKHFGFTFGEPYLLWMSVKVKQHPEALSKLAIPELLLTSHMSLSLHTYNWQTQV